MLVEDRFEKGVSGTERCTFLPSGIRIVSRGGLCHGLIPNFLFKTEMIGSV